MGEHESIVWGNAFTNFSRILGVIRSPGSHVVFTSGNLEAVFLIRKCCVKSLKELN